MRRIVDYAVGYAIEWIFCLSVLGVIPMGLANWLDSLGDVGLLVALAGAAVATWFFLVCDPDVDAWLHEHALQSWSEEERARYGSPRQ